MKNYTKIIVIAVCLLLAIGIISLISAVIKGAFHLVGGFFDVILGIVIILALVAIVIWMFSYAAKNKK